MAFGVLIGLQAFDAVPGRNATREQKFPMAARTLAMTVLSLLLVLGGPCEADADSIVVTDGYVLVDGRLPNRLIDFLLQGEGFSAYGQFDEAPAPDPVFALPGETVNLSARLIETFGNFALVREFDFWARADFSFTAGDVVAPTAEELVDLPRFSKGLSTPFSFSGLLEGFPSREALEQGGAPSFSYQLSGAGFAEETFALQVLQPFTPRPDLPLRRNRTAYTFTAGPAATPEPMTALLLATGGGIAAIRSYRRKHAQECGRTPRAFFICT
jgi:hypothetical protein